MNPFLQNNRPPSYPSVSPNLQNSLQNGNQSQPNQQPSQQHHFMQTNLSNPSSIHQTPQISPTLLNRPRQTHGQFSYPIQEQANITNNVLNNTTPFSDLNNNGNGSGNRRHQFASSTGEEVVSQGANDSQFVPNRYITPTGGRSSMFLNQRLLQSYAQQVKQSYERMPAPPSYPGTQPVASQHSGLYRRMTAPPYQQSMFSNSMDRGGGNPSSSSLQQQQQQQQQQTSNALKSPTNSMYSQALMRRLSGQASANENQVSEQQGRRSFLMQHLQSNRNNSNMRVSSAPESNVLSPNIPNENIGNSCQNLEQARTLLDDCSTLYQTNQARQNDGNTGNSFQQKELLPNPFSNKIDDVIHSPMSVGSNKSDGSASEMKTISALSVSLNSSHNSDSFSQISASKDLSPTFTEMLQKIKVDSFDLEDEEDAENVDSKTSFIDAVLTGMLSEFSGVDKTKSGCMENVDINLLDMNLFGLLENEENDIHSSDSAEEGTHIQRSLSSSSLSPKPSVKENEMKKKTKPRLSRLKSDTTGYSIEARSSAHPYNRLSGVPSDLRTSYPEKPGAFKRRHTVTSAAGDKSSLASHMYFENKDCYKFRERLRDLIHLQVQAGILTPGQTSMKSSRLFLNLLTKRHEWVNESVKAAVKNGKEMNMKNFTKRKITVHNDISPEHIHKFSEVSSEPFTYLNLEATGKTKPSDKLMEYLQQQKRKQQPQNQELPTVNITSTSAFSPNNDIKQSQKPTNR